MIHVGITIEPIHSGLILRPRRMYGKDKDVANRIRIHKISPEAMCDLRTMPIGTNILEKSFSRMCLQSCFDPSRSIEKPIARGHRSLQIKAERNQVPSIRLCLAEVRIRRYDRALFPRLA